jgi:membrane protease YdiL (CAAX protease family)
MSAEEMNVSPMAAIFIVVVAVVVIGAVPAILHGVVFAYIWTWSGSLAVVTFYHLAYDGVRDSIQITIGGGSISGLWVTVVLCVLGIILLIKGDWFSLRIHEDNGAEEIAAEQAIEA